MKSIDSQTAKIPIAANDTWVNNIASDGATAGPGTHNFDLYYIHNYSGATCNSASRMVTTSDYNVYWLGSVAPPTSTVGIDFKPGTPSQYVSMALARSTTNTSLNPQAPCNFIDPLPWLLDAHSVDATSIPYD